jgi:hypothetical protein
VVDGGHDGVVHGAAWPERSWRTRQTGVERVRGAHMGLSSTYSQDRPHVRRVRAPCACRRRSNLRCVHYREPSVWDV